MSDVYRGAKNLVHVVQPLVCVQRCEPRGSVVFPVAARIAQIIHRLSHRVDVPNVHEYYFRVAVVLCTLKACAERSEEAHLLIEEERNENERAKRIWWNNVRLA